jgi:hypothetical protein
MVSYRLSGRSGRSLYLNAFQTYAVFKRHGRILGLWEKNLVPSKLPDVEGELFFLNCWEVLSELNRLNYE